MNLRLTHIAHLGGIRPLGTKALRGKDLAEFPTIQDAFLTINNGKISDFGPMTQCPEDELERFDCTGRSVLPAFVDSHSHLVYAGTREQEFNLRLKGASYEEIAAAGGGILNSAKKVGETSLDLIVSQSAERLDRLIHHGTGTLEVKSGYGLDAEGEIKLLRAIARLNDKTDATLVPTFLAAHALPIWAKERGWNDEKYTHWMLDELMPTIIEEGLARFLDGFIERDYFRMGTLEALLEASKIYNIPTKLHVNQFYDIGAIPRAVEAGALSVDHLEVMSEDAFKALEGSDTIATLLPSCSYFIGIPYAPARRLIDSGTLVALATDYNPGSSPTGNMQLVMNMACTKMKMTPAEALNAATLNGAAALQLEEHKGSITIGKDADLLITRRIPSIEFIAYDFGTNHMEHTLLGGTFQ